MANIHFIWWGPCPPEGEKLVNCIASPFYVATNCPNHQVFFWCKDSALKVFQEKFKISAPSIQVRSCSQVKKIVGTELYAGNDKQWFKDAMGNISILNKMKANAAVKDLLSLIILYTHGGFYFDTTTIINNYATLNNYLSAPTAKRAPSIAGGSVYYINNLQTQKLIFTNNTNDFMGYDAPLPQIDVWAMYSPPGDLATEMMYKSYVSRCNHVGVYPGAKRSAGIQQLRPDAESKNADRNLFIASLVTLSVYDGLVTVTCAGDGNRLNDYCWNATPAPTKVEGKYYADQVADLGLTKYYTNSWKNTK